MSTAVGENPYDRLFHDERKKGNFKNVNQNFYFIHKAYVLLCSTRRTRTTAMEINLEGANRIR
jgi:hypothetical protein